MGAATGQQPCCCSGAASSNVLDLEAKQSVRFSLQEPDDLDKIEKETSGQLSNRTDKSRVTFTVVNDYSTEEQEELERLGSTCSTCEPGQGYSKEALLSRLEYLVDVSYDILMAEEVLQLLKTALADSPQEWQEVRRSSLYERFSRRLVYFAEVGQSVCADMCGWFSVFEADGGRQSIKVLLDKYDPNKVDYRVSALIPAHITHVLAVANEIQLLPTWNTLVTGTPRTIGRRTAHYMMLNYQMSVLGGMYKLDVLNEVRRFSNIEGGFLAEYIESAEEDHPSYTPPPSGYKRPSTKIQNVWVSVGSSHTLLIQFGSVRTPFNLGKWLVQSLGTLAGKIILGGIVKNSLLASKPGNAWEQPRLKDSLGLYARLDECAAAKVSQERAPAADGQPQEEYDLSRYFDPTRRAALLA